MRHSSADRGPVMGDSCGAVTRDSREGTAGSLARCIEDYVAGHTEAWDSWVEALDRSQLLELVEGILAMCADT